MTGDPVRNPTSDGWAVSASYDDDREVVHAFGGRAYGLEPLILPLAEDPLDPSRGLWSEQPLEVLARPGPRAGRTVEPVAAEDVDQHAWFRWITGHQASFVLWRLLGAEVEDHLAACGAELDQLGETLTDLDEVTVARWARYVDGYSEMLLYSGSCSTQTYHRLIRPSMRLQHPSFSGSWAPDYLGVRRLLHDRRLLGDGAAARPLTRSTGTMHLVHDRVAERLVPGGASLLRASPVRRQDWGDTAFLYDSYFLTRRAPVDRRTAAVQLVRRLHAVTDDLATHGLYHPEERACTAPAGVQHLEEELAEEIGALVSSVVEASTRGALTAVASRR